MMFPLVTRSFQNMTPLNTKLKTFAMSNKRTTPIGVKVKGALDVVDYCFITTVSCNFQLMWGKMCCKRIAKLKT
jgi:hypothetical protein